MVMASMGLAIVLRRKTEECLPIVFMGTIVVLYIFYCLNFLHVGRFFIYAALLELIVMGAIVLFKSDELKKNLFKDYLTLPLAIFIGLSIVIIIFAFDLKPNLWDELRLWAASPKTMFYIGNLQIGNDAVLYPEMQSYPPAMALLSYFAISLSGNYLDATPFIVMSILGIAILVSALKKITWKMWPIAGAVCAIIILMPCILTIGSSDMGGDWAYYYVTIFIDMILGIVTGFALFLAVKNPFSNWFDTLKFSVVMFVLPMFKNTGAYFAAIIFLIALVILLVNSKANNHHTKGQTKKSLIISIIIPILATAVSYFSWQLLINIKGIGEYTDIFAFAITKKTLSVFFNSFVTWGKISLLVYFIAFIILDILITFFIKDIKAKDMLIASIGILVLAIIFYIGYLNTYSDYFTSLLRYSYVLTFMLFTYLFMRFISSIKTFALAPLKSLEGKIYGNRFFTMIIIIACSLALLVATFVSLALWKKNVHVNDTYKRAEEITKDISGRVDKEKFTVKNPAKVYIIFKGEYSKNSLLHETCFYESIGSCACIKNVSYDNIVFFMNSDEVELYDKAAKDDSKAKSKLSTILIDRLVSDKYDYVYVAGLTKTDEDILKNITDTKNEIKEGALFYINKENKTLH